MSTNLAKQLAKLKLAENNNDRNLKSNERATILFTFKKAAEISQNEIIEMTKSSLDKLVESSPMYYHLRTLMDDLLNNTKNYDRDMLLDSENLQVKEKIKRVLLIISQNFLETWALQIMETLLRVFQVHRYEAELLILLFMPFHSTAQYIRLLQNINLANKSQWYFNMEKLVRKGQAISRNLLVSKFLRHYKSILSDLFELVLEVRNEFSKFESQQSNQKGFFIVQKKSQGFNEKEKEFILLRFWTVLTFEFFYYYNDMELKLMIKTLFFRLCQEFFEKQVFSYQNSVFLLLKIVLENNILSQTELDFILLDFHEKVLPHLSPIQKTHFISQLQKFLCQATGKSWFIVNSQNLCLFLEYFKLNSVKKIKIQKLMVILMRLLEFFMGPLKDSQAMGQFECINEIKIFELISLIDDLQELIFDETNFHNISSSGSFNFFIKYFSKFLFQIFLFNRKSSSNQPSNNQYLKILQNESNGLLSLIRKIKSNLQEGAIKVIELLYQITVLHNNENANQKISQNDLDEFILNIFGNLIQYGVVGSSDLISQIDLLDQR
jgi:hypothetical protein